MLLVVRKSDGFIIERLEAWLIDAEERAYKAIAENGYKAIEEEITFLGDKIIWVE